MNRGLSLLTERNEPDSRARQRLSHCRLTEFVPDAPARLSSRVGSWAPKLRLHATKRAQPSKAHTYIRVPHVEGFASLTRGRHFLFSRTRSQTHTFNYSHTTLTQRYTLTNTKTHAFFAFPLIAGRFRASIDKKKPFPVASKSVEGTASRENRHNLLNSSGLNTIS